MNETKELVNTIVEGIQNRKGKRIVIADLTEIEDTICDYFVICQGNSPSQVMAIVDSIRDSARENMGAKPYAIDGLKNSQWVALDYGEIIVHIFLPEEREYYNLENLWADSKLTELEDID